ncbi:hypothetical protein A2U01_0066711, partial [Trifolium medium]|nr:hypothetical protein [Trifolium medium]
GWLYGIGLTEVVKLKW